MAKTPTPAEVQAASAQAKEDAEAKANEKAEADQASSGQVLAENPSVQQPEPGSLATSDPGVRAEEQAKRENLPNENTVGSFYNGGDAPTVITAGVVTTDHSERQRLLNEHPPLPEAIPALDPTPAEGDPAKPAVIAGETATRRTASDLSTG